MARQPTREELAAALIDLYLEVQHLKMLMSHYADPMIDAHNARAFKRMKNC